MKKNQMMIKVLVITTIVSLGWLTSVIIRGDASTIELVVSICSVLVTLLLGVVTYVQTNTQIDIEAMEKTPYLRVLTLTEISGQKYDLGGTSFLFDNIHYLEGRQAGEDYFVEMTLENISDVCIENATCYITGKKDDKIIFVKDSGEVNAYTKRSNLEKTKLPEDKKKKMKEEFKIWDQKSMDLLPINNMVGNKTRKLGLKLPNEPQINEVIKYFVIFDISTIYGFEYTEMLELYLERVCTSKDETKFLLAIEKYNTKIYPVGFAKCQNKIRRYIKDSKM